MRDDWKEKKREWSDKNKYNSFNSYKGLTLFDSHYIPIAKWFKGESKDLPAPVELSLDPAHLCNFRCGHCNAQRYLIANPEEVPSDRKIMSQEHLRNLIDFAADWGVRGVCIGGGGEPLMNRNVWELPSYIHKKGLKSSFATNGSLINDQIANEMMYCRWVGVSLDSGSREVFKKVHGVDHFDKVISNLQMLINKKNETKSKIDIAYKFLIRPDNWQDVESACRLAKNIGVRDFHARPVDLERKDFEAGMQLNYDMDTILEQFTRCHQLEDENFRVFTVMHKYDPNFRVKHTFKNCVSSSLMLQACSDGNAYVCADHRIEERFKLCSHYPNPEEVLNFWGSEKHRDLLKSINVDKECGRCTYGEYARQIEELALGQYEEDPMCIDFP
jgi:MoaA/NifB/PqqE/SkfB family radical SAM enzyme